jgi:hypothetical protein
MPQYCNPLPKHCDCLVRTAAKRGRFTRSVRGADRMVRMSAEQYAKLCLDAVATTVPARLI